MSKLGGSLQTDLNVGNAREIQEEFERIRHVVHINQLVATSTSFRAGIAPFAMELKSVKEKHGTASTSGTLMVGKGADGEAVGGASEKDCLSAAIDLSATADTNQSGSLTTTTADLQFAAGDAIVITLGGTLTSLADCCATLEFQRI